MHPQLRLEDGALRRAPICDCLRRHAREHQASSRLAARYALGIPSREHCLTSGRDKAIGTLDDLERMHIRRVLEATEGVISGPKGAAKILGLHPSTLRSRMERLGMAE